MYWLKRLYLILLIATSCQEPFDFQLPNASLVVVDAKVSTLVGETSVIIYSTSNEEVQKRKNLSGFDVDLMTSSGAVVDFVEIGKSGVYKPTNPNFVGVIGESYSLKSVSVDDYTIRSDYDTISAPVDFELIIEETVETELNTETNALIEKSATGAFIEVQADREKYFSRFTFRYEYDHFFTGSREVKRPVDEFVLYECLDANNCSSPSREQVGSQAQRTWTFWDSTDPRCDSLRQTRYVAEHPNGILAAFVSCAPDSLAGVPLGPTNEYLCCCCITFDEYLTDFVVVQETLSNQSFRFWQNVDRLLSNDGLIFDTFPFPVTGNISCEDCPFSVVGQLRAVSETRRSQEVIL